MRYKPKKENIEKLKTFLKKEKNKKQKINYGKSI
tara:strand:- start:33 stop:134 length:102 start_codon:yes stop_codon:yes gene_type:complete